MVFAAGYGTPPNSMQTLIASTFEVIKPPYRLGLVFMDSPQNRVYFEKYFMQRQFPKLGLGEFGLVQYFSPAAPDPTPFALKFKEANIDAVVYAGPGAPGVAIKDALRKIGWNGVMAIVVGEPLEPILEKIKDPKVLRQMSTVSLLSDMPELDELRAAATKYGVTEVNSQLLIGWNAARVVEEIFTRTGYPATTDKLLEVMNNFQFSLKPLAYGVEWSPTDHSGPGAFQSWRWNPAKGEFVAGDWILMDTGGVEWTVLGPEL